MNANRNNHLLRRLAVLTAILVLTAWIPAGSGQQTADNATLADQPAHQPWGLDADKVSSEHDSEIIEAWGDVILTHGDNYLKADYARYYHKTGWVFLKGEVEAFWGEDYLTADEAEFDLRNKMGWMKNGTVFVSQTHLYITGKHMEKHAGATYSFKDAVVTACDGETPAWSVAAREGEVTIDGYATLKHSRFRIKDVPAFYSPYAVLPVKTKRQSGLLFPEYGSSSRLGTFYNQPFFWAISDETDATYWANYMSDRGLMHGFEFRATPDVDTRALWRFDYLHDSEVAETERDEDSQFDDDDLTRPNRDRWWLRGKFDGHLGDPRWKAKLDVDYVSDQNYLREFKNGATGFEATEKLFQDKFRRDLADKDELERSSTLVVTRDFGRLGVSGLVQGTENLKYMNNNNDPDRNPSLQRLPELAAYVYKDRLFSTPLEWQVDLDAAHYWRRFGTRGERFEARPRLSLPARLGPVSFITTAGLRATGYSVDEWDPDQPDHDDNFTGRQIFDFNSAAFTEAWRVFSLDHDLPVDAVHAGNSTWTAVKHTVQPRLEYDFTDSRDQSQKPYYDDRDRIPAQSELTYSLTNFLERRMDSVGLAGDGDDQRATLTTDYREFLRLRVLQSYDAREATRNDMRGQYPRRPFSDIEGELTIQPEKWLSLTSTTAFSPYLGSITEHDHSVSLSWAEVAEASVGLNFRESLDEYKRRARQRLRQLRLGTTVYLSRRWSAGFSWRSDLQNSEDLEKILSVIYKHQCFNFVVSYSRTPFEERFEMNVEMVGLSF